MASGNALLVIRRAKFTFGVDRDQRIKEFEEAYPNLPREQWVEKRSN
jgi:hypothetical protein